MITQKEATTNGSAIENIVCKAIEKCDRVEMDKDLFETFIMLIMAKDKKFEIPEKEKPFIYQVIEKRIKHCYTFKTNDPRLIMFLSALAVKPGTAILYLWYLQYWCKKNSVKEIDLDIFGTRIFPLGFPSEETMHKIWDSQKVNRDSATGGSDNLVDYNDAGSSLHFMN